MKILLDIDGVLVTTPIWRTSELLADGFLKFNERAVNNLVYIISETAASVVLTTTHRINFSLDEWYSLFEARGIAIKSISKINEKKSIDSLGKRSDEIQVWVDQFGETENYVIIDDDLSINSLPELIKSRWVMTKPMIGLNKEAADKALDILQRQSK